MTTSEPTKKVHHGRNVKRFREMLGLKQEALAIELGEDWSQKKVSRLEENEVIEDDTLLQVANVLRVPVEAIKQFDPETAINNIQNNYDSSVINSQINYQFSPIDKILELMEENKKLYERLLAAEKEKVALLERVLEQGK